MGAALIGLRTTAQQLCPDDFGQTRQEVEVALEFENGRLTEIEDGVGLPVQVGEAARLAQHYADFDVAFVLIHAALRVSDEPPPSTDPTNGDDDKLGACWNDLELMPTERNVVTRELATANAKLERVRAPMSNDQIEALFAFRVETFNALVSSTSTRTQRTQAAKDTMAAIVEKHAIEATA